MTEQEFIDDLAEGEKFITEEDMESPNSDYHWIKKGEYRTLSFNDGTSALISTKFWEKNNLDEFDYVEVRKVKNRNGMAHEGDTLVFYGRYFEESDNA